MVPRIVMEMLQDTVQEAEKVLARAWFGAEK